MKSFNLNFLQKNTSDMEDGEEEEEDHEVYENELVQLFSEEDEVTTEWYNIT